MGVRATHTTGDTMSTTELTAADFDSFGITGVDLMVDLASTPKADSAVAEAVVEANDYDDDYAFDYDDSPGYSAVEGDGHAGPEHYDNLLMGQIEVIPLTKLLGIIYPGYWDMSFKDRPDLDDERKAVKAWIAENDAHYFVWEGYSFGSGAMEMVACANAVALGKSKVVIEGLS